MIKRILALKQKKDAVMARLALAEAQQAKQERKLETRKRILIGAAIITAIQRGKFQQDQLMQLLAENLSERDQRAFRI
jgi:hypothetical protein